MWERKRESESVYVREEEKKKERGKEQKKKAAKSTEKKTSLFEIRQICKNCIEK